MCARLLGSSILSSLLVLASLLTFTRKQDNKPSQIVTDLVTAISRDMLTPVCASPAAPSGYFLKCHRAPRHSRCSFTRSTWLCLVWAAISGAISTSVSENSFGSLSPALSEGCFSAAWPMSIHKTLCCLLRSSSTTGSTEVFTEAVSASYNLTISAVTWAQALLYSRPGLVRLFCMGKSATEQFSMYVLRPWARKICFLLQWSIVFVTCPTPVSRGLSLVPGGLHQVQDSGLA